MERNGLACVYKGLYDHHTMHPGLHCHAVFLVADSCQALMAQAWLGNR